MLSILLSLIACEPMKVVFEEPLDTGIEHIGPAPLVTEVAEEEPELIGSDSSDDTGIVDTGAETFTMTIDWNGGANWDQESDTYLVLEAHTYGVDVSGGRLSVYKVDGMQTDIRDAQFSDMGDLHGILRVADEDMADVETFTDQYNLPLMGLTFVYRNIMVVDSLPGYTTKCIVWSPADITIDLSMIAAGCTEVIALPA